MSETLQPIETSLDILKKWYKERAKLIARAYEITEIILPLMPANWDVAVQVGDLLDLNFICHDESPIEEFRLMRRLLFMATKIEPEVYGTQGSAIHSFLRATVYIHGNEGQTLFINVFGYNITGCQLTPEIIPEHTEYKVGNGCLSDPAEVVDE